MMELRLLGTKCNIGCHYCYQNPLRDSGNGSSKYNVDFIKNKLNDLNEPFVLWGGEPLLAKFEDLESLFELGFSKFGENQILTNGTLITDKHILLFKKYNVSVTISLDGIEELNDVRWAGSIELTRKYTQLSNNNLVKLLEEKISTSLNFQITRCNSSPERLPKMFKWLTTLDKIGLKSARIHVLEIDYNKPLGNYAFDVKGNIKAFLEYKVFERSLKNLKFDLFENMKSLLKGQDEMADCVWRGCDAHSTEAVSGIDGQGRLNNCGNTDKEGINFQKPDKVGYERYIALYHVPDEFGGCKGCNYFVFCKGQCPGTAMSGDWRNKSQNCGLFKELFKIIEDEIIESGGEPISKYKGLIALEKMLIESWSIDSNPSIEYLLKKLSGEGNDK